MPPQAPRATENVVAILTQMLERPRTAFYGLQLANEAGIGSATVYAALTRLERAGLVVGSWEAIDPAREGRPRRRLYRLTGKGARVGREMVAAHKPRRRSERGSGWFGNPQGQTP